jgi:hypothetical protein
MSELLQDIKESIALHQGSSPGLRSPIESRSPLLNTALAGALCWGDLVEWGVPPGQGGREIILMFLAHVTSIPASHACSHEPCWALWVSASSELTIYPPAWAARGVDLNYIRFACCNHAVEDLKPLWMDPFFKFIVLDDPRHLSSGDLAFIARRARLQKQAVMILRPFVLHSDQGNVWARLRINGGYDPQLQQFSIQIVKGAKSAQKTRCCFSDSDKTHRGLDHALHRS